MNTDRRIHRSQCDGHGNDRANQFAGRIHSRSEGRLAQLNMPLDVFHDDDRIIYYQANREHDRKQSQKVDGEARHQHQEDGANQ